MGGTFDLIIGSADAQSTYSITFTLQNGAVQSSHLSSMGAAIGQVLKFNGTNWIPSNLTSSQVYLGGWDATSNTPTLADGTTPTSGEYYIVTTAGSKDLGGGVSVSYQVGDWVISNGTSWDKISSNSLSGAGTTNYIPYYSSSSVLANSPMYISGSNIGIGKITPGSALDIKGTLRLSGATSGFVGFTPAAIAGSTTYTLPVADGTAPGQVLSTNGAGVLSWVDPAVVEVGGVSAANIATGVNTANAATNVNNVSTVVKRDASGNFSAGTITATLNGSATNVSGTVAVANGGTGNTTLGLNQLLFGNGTSAIGGLTTTSTPSVLLSTITTGAPAWTTSTAGNFLQGSVTGAIFGPITNISPGADFTLTQNSVAPFTSVNAGAVANTLYLKAGNVGIGTTAPGALLDVKGAIRMSGSTSGYAGFQPAADAGSTVWTLPSADGTSSQVLSTNGSGSLSWSPQIPPNTTSIYQVRAATTASITLSGLQTIDNVALIAGNRVLVKNQNGANGIYIVAAGAWTRATDMSSWSQTINYIVQVSEGSLAGMTYVSATGPGGTLGTTTLEWNAMGSLTKSMRALTFT